MEAHPGVRSNTRNVHSSVIPSAALQLNHRLCPHVGTKGCGDRTIVCGGLYVVANEELNLL